MGASDSMMTVRVRSAPGSSRNRRGLTVMLEPGGAWVVAVNRSGRPLAFLTTRVVTRRPGMTGALMDGTFRWTTFTGSPPSAAKSPAVSSSVSGA